MKRIEILLSFPALICILGWLDYRLCLWFLLGALLHELGHLLMLKLCRVQIMGIRISCFGASIGTGIISSASEILCALAGPAAGLLAAAVFLRCAPDFALVNFCLSAANLLPLLPLDGGRILAALLSGRKNGEAILHSVQFVTCCCLMVLACWLTAVRQAGLWPIFLSLTVLWRTGTQ